MGQEPTLPPPNILFQKKLTENNSPHKFPIVFRHLKQNQPLKNKASVQLSPFG